MGLLKNNTPLSPLRERDDGENDPRWSDTTLVNAPPDDKPLGYVLPNSQPEEVKKKKKKKKHNLGGRVKYFLNLNTKNRLKPIEIVPTFSTLPYRFMLPGTNNYGERTENKPSDPQLRQDIRNYPGLAIWHGADTNGTTDAHENPFDLPSDNPLVRAELAKAEEKWKRISDEMELTHKKEFHDLNDLLFRADAEIAIVDEKNRYLLSEVNNQRAAAEVAGKRWGELKVLLRTNKKEKSAMQASIIDYKKHISKLQSKLESRDQKVIQLSAEVNEANEQLIFASNKNAKYLKENDDAIAKLKEENLSLQELLEQLSNKNISLQEKIIDLQSNQKETTTKGESPERIEEKLEKAEKAEKAPSKFEKAFDKALENNVEVTRAGSNRIPWKWKM